MPVTTRERLCGRNNESDNNNNNNNSKKKKKNQVSSSSCNHHHHHDNVATELVALVSHQFQSLADSQRAVTMKKYLKTDMPMYGVARPQRFEVEKKARAFLATHYHPSTPTTAASHHSEQQEEETTTTMMMTLESYLMIVETLWNLPMREEKYLAIDLAIYYYRNCINTPSSKDAALSLYESMLRQEYMWWDLVDPIATHLIGKTASKSILQRWIQDENLWIRRSALLAQLKFKHQTDEALLFQFCQLCAHEKEFFIRKAIGWALREYSKTSPQAVKTFLQQEESNLSGLSYREGAKILIRQGLL